MSQLARLQQDFHAYLLDPENNTGIVSAIVSTENVSAQTRLAIYSNAYRLRLLGLLAMDYPLSQRLIGETAFEQFAREYIDQCAPDHYSPIYFSRHFSRFLTEHHQDKTLYAEFVALEWGLLDALLAQEGGHLAVTDLAKIPPENWAALQFTLHPSFTIKGMRTHAATLYRAMIKEPEMKEDGLPESMISGATSTVWAVWRFERQPYFQSLTPEQAWMLAAIKQEQCFADICMGLCTTFDLSEQAAGQLAAQMLFHFIQWGQISAVMNP
jgi:hypothetical protein